MTRTTQPLLASTDGPYGITPRDVVFNDGPLAGTHERVTRAHAIDGRKAIISYHGEGFYWLPAPTSPTPDGAEQAVWERHTDARFSWSRYV